MLLATACSGGGSSAPSGQVVLSVASSTATTRVDLKFSDALRIEPVSIDRSKRVTFVASNVGSIDHEFIVGDEAAQVKRYDGVQVGSYGRGL